MSGIFDRRDPTLRIATLAVRLALSAAFLSAVADRLGFWGPPGAEGVAWGDVASYENYVAILNWFLPSTLIPLVGWSATIAEVGIALGLIIGWRLRWFSLAAAILLSLFGLTMAVAFTPKSPLDYSVFSAATAAFLLFALTRPSPADDSPNSYKPAS